MVAIASPERFVVGLDVSENAIKQATKVRANTFVFLDLVLQSFKDLCYKTAILCNLSA